MATTTTVAATTTSTSTTTLPPTTTTLAPTTTTLPIIGSGTYIVPDEIVPGVYRVAGYYARLDANQEIIKNDLTSSGPTLLQVLPTDAYVKIDGEALPMAASRPLDPVAEGYTDGTFLVGYDLAPGRYRITKEGGGSYFARLDKRGEIINNDLSDGPVVVVVRPTDWALRFDGAIAHA